VAPLAGSKRRSWSLGRKRISAGRAISGQKVVGAAGSVVAVGSGVSASAVAVGSTGSGVSVGGGSVVGVGCSGVGTSGVTAVVGAGAPGVGSPGVQAARAMTASSRRTSNGLKCRMIRDLLVRRTAAAGSGAD